ncbi:MAG: two pore domain potassium channel family protein [Gammaproteobacteria bacterium]|nr:two pore domain potassium channel family protein [Gammaproteobacteria bacterium]
MTTYKVRPRFRRFLRDLLVKTPFVKLILVFAILWVVFSTGVFLAEKDYAVSSIQSWTDALYWGVAAFSTAGIADTPVSDLAKLIGGIWIILGSALFFGTIVATISTYFFLPMLRPHRKIIDTIEYNLEQLDALTVEEMDLLKETVDTLINHMENLKARQTTAI